MRGLPFSGLFMVSAPGGPCIETGRTSRPLAQAVRWVCTSSLVLWREKAGVGSGEVSLKLSSGASLPTLLPLSATPSTA